MPLKDSRPPSSTPDTDSLVRRLAGPSTTKAGLAKDQTEINKIIAEASKGSKFYENEKRKDKDLTERIEKILKHRDEVVKGVDLAKVEQGVDKLITQLEAHRDLSQVIVHVDMDAFFASVELLDNPDLASKPFGVGHGVLSTASYEARKFGVRSGMPTFIARKLCPELIVISSHFHRYGEMSEKVMAIFRRYDPNMAAAGCDEGYLNITSYCEEHSLTPEECVSQMREIVHQETKLTVSAGIAPNKNKPNGQFKLDFEPEAIKAFMHDLSIRKVPGVGRVHERLLDSIGIKTCGDIFAQRAVLSLMDKEFGLMFLLQAYLGIASNVIEPWQREERKSIGAERTFNPISDTVKIHAKLEEVAAELSGDMTAGGWTGKTITLKYKLDTYKVFTRAKSLDKWVSTRQQDLFALGKELLKPELPLTLRLIGLRVTKLKDLKAEAESKASGIKRFFNSGPADGSPAKKRRTEEVSAGEDDLPQLSQDGFATSMPGYTDEADADAEHLADMEEQSGVNDMKPASNIGAAARPPSSSASQRACTAKPSSSASGPTSPRKKRISSSTNDERGTSSDASAPLLECPICGKLLETDNQGLNEHIDFCLSKQAIKEAQTASLKPPSHSGSSSDAKKRGPKFAPPKAAAKGHGEGLLKFRKKG
ncbi:DNA/RNA polymerase [Lentinus tigrinus ALCF2SS1-7]|uniref:DNA polymerase kappa n=1 Tax=Lentinus tigrinus ALCF2SS1-6 TaxID=1328759 RepID=A0A5C2RU28_9APHY|nr:DNA/RNA polymerase [Lentinus tigrinus ALCF2SS1-6]RPD75336.1 DNA/RNA polymerase [Lentinus tigrinus ALCF2SS1-7]